MCRFIPQPSTPRVEGTLGPRLIPTDHHGETWRIGALQSGTTSPLRSQLSSKGHSSPLRLGSLMARLGVLLQISSFQSMLVCSSSDYFTFQRRYLSFPSERSLNHGCVSLLIPVSQEFYPLCALLSLLNHKVKKATASSQSFYGWKKMEGE